MLKIPTKLLLLVAAFVWLLAGTGVASVGVTVSEDPWAAYMALACLITFVLFLIMFLFITRKHIRRIKSYTDELTNLFKFFDPPSYVIIAIMIGLGMSVRISGLVPPDIIAFFYTGLGSALITSAIVYIVTYVAICDELTASNDRFASLIQKLQ